MKWRVELPSIVGAQLISAWRNRMNGEGKSWPRSTSTTGILREGS